MSGTWFERRCSDTARVDRGELEYSDLSPFARMDGETHPVCDEHRDLASAGGGKKKKLKRQIFR